MFDVSELRKGLRVEIDGVPYLITDFNFVKPGKGQAVYTCKFKNLISGSTVTKNYRSGDKLDEPHLEEKKLQFSYADGDNYIFIDKDYEQNSIHKDVLGTNRYFLVEDLEVSVLYHNGKPIDISLPTFVERKISHTEPGFKGNTATNTFKPATLEGGFEIQVPLFVNEGDVIVVDTRTFEYAERVAKK